MCQPDSTSRSFPSVLASCQPLGPPHPPTGCCPEVDPDRDWPRFLSFLAELISWPFWSTLLLWSRRDSSDLNFPPELILKDQPVAMVAEVLAEDHSIERKGLDLAFPSGSGLYECFRRFATAAKGSRQPNGTKVNRIFLFRNYMNSKRNKIQRKTTMSDLSQHTSYLRL